MNFPRPIITREHGSWAILLVPMAIAAGTVGDLDGNAFLLVVAALGVFMGTVPTNMLVREYLGSARDRERSRAAAIWGTLYLTVAIVAAIPLLIQRFWALIPLAAAGFAFFLGSAVLTRQYQKMILTDLISVAGLTLGAPAMSYVLTRSLDGDALVLYLLNVLFFGSGVCYVHMKMQITKSKHSGRSYVEKLTAGRLILAYHVVAIGAVLALSFYRLTPATAVLAFVPMTIHAVYGTYRRSSRTSFSRLGFTLLAHSILFGLLWTLIVHS